jgi:hypothetical protein
MKKFPNADPYWLDMLVKLEKILETSIHVIQNGISV